MSEFEVKELSYEPKVKHPLAYMRIARQKYEIMCFMDANGADMDEVVKDESKNIEKYQNEFDAMTPEEQKQAYDEVVARLEGDTEIMPENSTNMNDVYDERVKVYSILTAGIQLYDQADFEEIENMENYVRDEVRTAIDKIGGYDAYKTIGIDPKMHNAYIDAKNDFAEEFEKAQNEFLKSKK